MEFSIDLISRKVEGCIRTLEKSIRRSAAWEKAMERAYADLTRLECDPPRDIVSLRALEAGSAAAYFRAWRAVPLKWVGTGRRAIPASWRAIGSRTSVYKQAGNRNAAHPVQAMLSYAYAVLESQVRIQLVSDGFDPTQGIMHETRKGSSAFVFDMMEPERPKVDRAVLEFLKANQLHPADFTIRPDGVCRLNPEMAMKAARGDHRAQHKFTELLSETERANKAFNDELVKAAMKYKFGWEKELERRKKLGITEPEPLPHPDDIVLDMKTDQVIIKGPMTKEEKVEWDWFRERLKEFDREIEELTAMLKDPKMKSCRHIIHDDILHAKRLRDITVKAIGEPRRDDIQ